MKIFNTFISQKFKSKNDIDVVFDIGACHALESVEFAKKFSNAKIFTFEANPISYEVCLENTKDYPSISVINKAVNDYDGVCKFYPIDKEKTITTWEDGNQGASSLYKANGAYDHIEKYVQYEIEIPCIRLDTFCKENNINKIDIIWMDLQGAELKALQSLDSLLETVQIIHTELEMNPMYENQCLFNDVYEFLLDKGFDLDYGDTNSQFGSNFIFTNQR
ncbi:MAG: FkbM family methyltransferase [Candidatus Fonsibacter ubiquis]